MVNPGWSRTESPFHAGELAIQTRMGIREGMDRQGRRVIREYLTQQHRQFFAQLPYLIVGTVDSLGNPWASILVGKPGFLSTPSDKPNGQGVSPDHRLTTTSDASASRASQRTLKVKALPLRGDPLTDILEAGIDIGFLGIELHTRRRNRLNGTVSAINADGFEVEVKQSFGNCPKYIQARMYELEEFEPTTSKSVIEISALNESAKALITRSDTFFITTAYQDYSAGAARGVDVSHRGGKPGFVRINGESTLTIPDFSGNCHFNTFGNLEVNPKAGLLFPDFKEGDLLYLTGTAEVIWSGTEIDRYTGAERLLRFHLDKGLRVQNSLPLRWSSPEFSPQLKNTGSW